MVKTYRCRRLRSGQSPRPFLPCAIDLRRSKKTLNPAAADARQRSGETAGAEERAAQPDYVDYGASGSASLRPGWLSQQPPAKHRS